MASLTNLVVLLKNGCFCQVFIITFSLSFLFFLFIFVIRAPPNPHPHLSVLSLARLVHQGVLANVVDADPRERRDIQDRSDLQAGVLSVFLAKKDPWVRLAPWVLLAPWDRRSPLPFGEATKAKPKTGNNVRGRM